MYLSSQIMLWSKGNQIIIDLNRDEKVCLLNDFTVPGDSRVETRRGENLETWGLGEGIG